MIIIIITIIIIIDINNMKQHYLRHNRYQYRHAIYQGRRPT